MEGNPLLPRRFGQHQGQLAAAHNADPHGWGRPGRLGEQQGGISAHNHLVPAAGQSPTLALERPEALERSKALERSDPGPRLGRGPVSAEAQFSRGPAQPRPRSPAATSRTRLSTNTIRNRARPTVQA